MMGQPREREKMWLIILWSFVLTNFEVNGRLLESSENIFIYHVLIFTIVLFSTLYMIYC